MTTHGLQGATVRQLGPGRQVADKAYHQLDLRQRLQDILVETQRLEDEMTQIDQEKTLHSQLTRKYENLLKELRLREGDLADFNLAIDKVRSRTQAADVAEMCERVRERNEHERQTIDDMFLRAAETERAAEELGRQAQEAHERIAARLGARGGEEVQHEYLELRDEESVLAREMAQKEQLLGELEARVQAAQAELHSDAYRVHARGLELRKLHAFLLKQKGQLEEEAGLGTLRCAARLYVSSLSACLSACLPA